MCSRRLELRHDRSNPSFKTLLVSIKVSDTKTRFQRTSSQIQTSQQVVVWIMTCVLPLLSRQEVQLWTSWCFTSEWLKHVFTDEFGFNWKQQTSTSSVKSDVQKDRHHDGPTRPVSMTIHSEAPALLTSHCSSPWRPLSRDKSFSGGLWTWL